MDLGIACVPVVHGTHWKTKLHFGYTCAGRPSSSPRMFFGCWFSLWKPPGFRLVDSVSLLVEFLSPRVINHSSYASIIVLKLHPELALGVCFWVSCCVDSLRGQQYQTPIYKHKRISLIVSLNSACSRERFQVWLVIGWPFPHFLLHLPSLHFV